MLYKIKTDIGCRVYIDDVLYGVAEAKELYKIDLNKGQYFAKFESIYDSNIYHEKVVIVEDSDIVEIVNMLPRTPRDKMILTPYKDNAGLYGYSELFSGEVIIPARYSSARDFYKHKFAIVKETSYGVIDVNGNIVLPCIYDSVEMLPNDYFIVEQNKRYQITTPSGTIQFAYDDWHYWQYLGIPDGYGHNDYDKNTIILGRKGGLLLFSCETGYNQYFDTAWSASLQSDGMIHMRFNNLQACIDRQFNLVIHPKYNSIGIFSNGISVVSIELDGRCYYGLINRKGEEVAPCIYHRIDEFYDGVAVASRNTRPDLPYTHEYGYIDYRGKEITQFIYDHADRFSEGLAVVCKYGRFFGCIDKNGVEKFSIDDSIKYCDYEFGHYVNGLLTYCKKSFYGEDRRFGFINDRGEAICSPNTYEKSCLVDEAAPSLKGYRLVKQNGLYGLIDRDGRIALPIRYKHISNDVGNLPDSIRMRAVLSVYTDSEWSILDQSLNEIIHIECDGFYPYNQYMIRIAKNKKIGLYSWEAGQLTDFVFDVDDVIVYGQRAFVLHNDDVGVVDCKGNTLVGMGVYKKRPFGYGGNYKAINVYYKGQPGFLLIDNLKFYPANEQFNSCAVNEAHSYIFICDEDYYGFSEGYYIDFSGKTIVPTSRMRLNIRREGRKIFVEDCVYL